MSQNRTEHPLLTAYMTQLISTWALAGDALLLAVPQLYRRITDTNKSEVSARSQRPLSLKRRQA